MAVITSGASFFFPFSQLVVFGFLIVLFLSSATASLIASLTTIHDDSLLGHAFRIVLSKPTSCPRLVPLRTFQPPISTISPNSHIRSAPRELVRSTRKLSKILGENPMPHVNRSSVISPAWKKSRESNIVDSGSSILSMAKKLARAALDPLQIVHRRDPDTNNEDIYGIKSSPEEMDALSRGDNWPSMLVLQAATTRDSEIDGDDGPYVSSQVPSPAMSSFSKRPPSVISASASKSTLFLPAEWDKSKEEREISHRRKRVSKLARHLGERIPPDLMLPKPMTVKLSRRSQRKRRFLPARTPPVPSTVPPLPAESPTWEQETTPSPSSPSSMFDVLRPAVEETVEVFEVSWIRAGRCSTPQFSQKYQRCFYMAYFSPLLCYANALPNRPSMFTPGGLDSFSDAIFLLER